VTAVIERVEINAPGVYDIDDVAYHLDPVLGGSLSSTGARKLLPPSCPALFDYERNHPPEPKDTFDIGHAAHKLALGVGPDIVEVQADSWRTNAAKDRREEIREAGGVPLLTADYMVVQEMAEALRAHPIASALLGDGGHAEMSLFWTDDRAGIWRRCRLDWHPSPRAGRMVAFDYKTTKCADPEKFARSAMDYGYHCQARWYLDGLRALDLADADAQFVFLAQEKSPPYLVSVVQLDAVALRIGDTLNRRAIDIYAECDRTGVWPGYTSDEVAHVSLPYWYEKQFEGVL
jgi:hypothetical protein